MDCQDEIEEARIITSDKSSTLHVFKQFQELYTIQLKNTDDTDEGLKLKVKILQSWVKDLTDQNEVLLQTVNDLEDEALKRLGEIEASIPQTKESESSKDDKQISYLCNDLYNLLELIRRLRECGFWYLDGLSFKTITYQDIFGVSPQECQMQDMGQPKKYNVTKSKNKGRNCPCP